MGGIKNASHTLRLIENLKNEEKRGKKEVIDLFKKILIAIDAQNDTPSVNKGLDELAVEVCELEEKLSIITNERDDLLLTVDKLKAEIRQLSANLMPIMQPLMPDQIVNQSPGIQEVKLLDDGDLNAMGQGQKRPRMRKRGREQKRKEQLQKQRSSNNPYNSNNYDFIGVEDADVKEIQHVISDEEVSQTKDRIQEQISKAQENDNLDHEHDAAQKINPEFHDAPDSKKFQCDQCPWSTPQRHRMKAHVEEVHATIKNHRCAECGYATNRKDRLERHRDARHNLGDKKFRCGTCPYSSAEKAKLLKHIERIHG